MSDAAIGWTIFILLACVGYLHNAQGQRIWKLERRVKILEERILTAEEREDLHDAGLM